MTCYAVMTAIHYPNGINVCCCFTQACQSCQRPFADEEKKHHCRSCGGGFCDECSANKRPVPERGWGTEPVRVCDGCYNGDPGSQQLAIQPALNLR